MYKRQVFVQVGRVADGHFKASEGNHFGTQANVDVVQRDRFHEFRYLLLIKATGRELLFIRIAYYRAKVGKDSQRLTFCRQIWDNASEVPSGKGSFKKNLLPFS